MYLAWINEFLCVARRMSITAAARELSMSQPNLSRHLKQLESELGFKLFVVQNRRIHLTTAGKHFLDNASVISLKFQELLGECRELAANEVVPLHVKVPPFDDGIASAYLLFLNNTLNANKHYHFIFESDSGNRSRGGSVASNYDIDVVYLAPSQIETFARDGWSMRHLGDARMGVWIEQGTPFAQQDMLSLDDLAQITIGFPNNPRHPLRKGYLTIMEEAGLAANFCTFQVENRYDFISSAPAGCSFLYPADLSHDYKMSWRGDLVFVPLCEQATLAAFAISKTVDLGAE